MKSKMSSLFYLFILLTAAPQTWAIVDLKNANFSDAWVDMNIPGVGFDLKIERGYNSRTLYNGIFGFGWCSEFESILDVTAEGNLKFTECGAGMEILYQAKNFNEKDIDKTVNIIVEKLRSEYSSNPPAYFAEMEKRLKAESALRGEYANKFGIMRTIADKTRFYANGREFDYIEKNGSNFVRLAPDGSTQKFKLNGKLDKIFDRNGNYLVFGYDGKRLHDVTDNNGRKITLGYFENGKVKTITGPGTFRTEYRYKNLNDLIWAKANSGNIYQYEYDDLHNLVKIIYPDKTTKEMTYDKNKDWITSYKDQEGCLESYDFKLSEDSPADHYWAIVQKKCKDKVVLKSRYEFWYQAKADKTGKFLQKSKSQENDINTEVIYNELGHPLNITQNAKVAKFEYFENGLLKRKIASDGVVTLFKYENTFKKVSRVERAGKASDFSYDNKGNLVKATNSDGQKISLNYDNKGRIAFIEDQAKRKVKIQYEERFGKPSSIEREGVGTISVIYTQKGEIAKVSSAAGTTVAMQVASAFNNLLDLIQPAGVNLNF